MGNNLEITNGVTGVRIVTAAANPYPFNLAPVQGIQLPGGSWTGAGPVPNRLYSQSSGYAGNVGEPLTTPMSSGTGYTVTIVDQGPLKTVVKVNYTFNRPPYTYPPVVINNAGLGHYTLTVTLYANSKSVLFDEDTDMELSYYLPVYAQLQPDTARWRGHDALNGSGVPDPACGYESPLTVTGASNARPIVITTSASGSLTNGQRVQIVGAGGNTAANGTYYAKTTGYSATQFALYSDAALSVPVGGTAAWTGGGTVKPAYRGQTLTPVPDAFQDLSYNLDRPAGYSCTANTYRKVLAAYPAASHAAGWYVEMYKSSAPATAPVVGFYVGRASKQVYSAIGPSLPGLYSSNNHFISHTQDAGIQVDTLLRSPDASFACAGPTPCQAAVHRNWGIFVSTKADLLNPANAHQPIADEQNMLTAINLSHLYSYQLVYPDPPGAGSGCICPRRRPIRFRAGCRTARRCAARPPAMPRCWRARKARWRATLWWGCGRATARRRCRQRSIRPLIWRHG